MKAFNEQIDPEFLIKARKLARLTRLLQNTLPAECHGHFNVAGIRRQILILITDSPVWTTRLRQLSTRILQYIRENSQQFADCLNDRQSSDIPVIHHIKISTRYHTENTVGKQSSKKSRRKPHISKKTAELLSRSASSINHKALKDALLKIASHGKNDKS